MKRQKLEQRLQHREDARWANHKRRREHVANQARRLSSGDRDSDWAGKGLAKHEIRPVLGKRRPSDLFMGTIVERFVWIPHDDNLDLRTKCGDKRFE
jgi:hypothetical protein